MHDSRARLPFAALFVAAASGIIAALLVLHWGDAGRILPDTDDAMRLVQLRDWLAGQGWFDLRQSRIALPYESHWSRLIDAGLAVLLLPLGAVFDAPQAERLMRTIWPLIWVVPTLAGMTAVAWRLGGRDAARIALLLAVAGVPAYQQFTPGRIDHHNVQIALTMLVLAATIWADRMRWCAVAAGALSGVGLAIGFESLPYLAGCGAALALRFIADGAAARPLRDYGLALTATLAAMFVAGVSPDRWMSPLCDALAFNAVAAIAAAALVLCIAASAGGSMRRRIAGVLLAGAAAIAATAVIEPRCLAGPYAMVDPAIGPIWLDHVRENQPLLRVLAVNPLAGSAIAIFPAVAGVAAMLLLHAVKFRHVPTLTAVFVLALSLLTALVAIRAYPYAMWIGMPIVATAALRLIALFGLRNAAARLALALALTPLFLSTGAVTVAVAAGMQDSYSFARPESRDCLLNKSFVPLARLPRGLMVADVSYGPYLLAHTPHRVLAGPYHRLGTGILASQSALMAPPGQAREILRAHGADYIAICGPRPPDGLSAQAQPQSLWGVLRGGSVPDWLEAVPDTGVYSVYRLRRG